MQFPFLYAFVVAAQSYRVLSEQEVRFGEVWHLIFLYVEYSMADLIVY